jgi:hypothetical protein
MSKMFQICVGSDNEWKVNCEPVGQSTDSYGRCSTHRSNSPELAQLVVAYAVLRGRLLKPEFCESCLRRCKVQAFHEDYSRALVVDWLCGSCYRVAESIRRSVRG